MTHSSCCGCFLCGVRRRDDMVHLHHRPRASYCCWSAEANHVPGTGSRAATRSRSFLVEKIESQFCRFRHGHARVGYTVVTAALMKTCMHELSVTPLSGVNAMPIRTVMGSSTNYKIQHKKKDERRRSYHDINRNMQCDTYVASLGARIELRRSTCTWRRRTLAEDHVQSENPRI